MINLSGKNLPERQRELNMKVREIIDKKIPFEIVKVGAEHNDVDKLLKIDVASNYRNIDYVLEILLSGDTLYISRVLKCAWIYDDAHSNIINPDYLHQNIFPLMSLKMKKKMLTTIFMYIKTEDRAVSFYHYCAGRKLVSNALKFLTLTSESFQLDIIDKSLKQESNNDQLKFSRKLFGASFTLLETYLQAHDDKQGGLLRVLLSVRHLYSVSDVKYLQLLEKYVYIEKYTYLEKYRACDEEFENFLGRRISKDIMKKHKHRVLMKPLLYLSILSQSQVAKFSTIEDAKLFAFATLPPLASDFWGHPYWSFNKYILNIIPREDLFDFFNKIFTENYPDEDFVTGLQIYYSSYIDIFTKEGKEKWALSQVDSKHEVFGVGKNFKWYKFVKFDVALEGIHKCIMNDPNNKFEKLVILIEIAKTPLDVLKLLKYYYETHINDTTEDKNLFMNSIRCHHNVYGFDEKCWNAYSKILYSMHIFSTMSLCDLRSTVVIYNITHGKEIPEHFKEIIDLGMSYTNKLNLSSEQSTILYEYVINFYVEKIKALEGKAYEGDVKKKIKKYIKFILDDMALFERPKEECPDAIAKYIKLDWDQYKLHRVFRSQDCDYPRDLEESDLIRLLKKDATLLKDQFENLKESMQNRRFRINKLLRKLKIYFSKDLAKEFLEFFLYIISEPDSYFATAIAVYSVFQLADEAFKIDFLLKCSPTELKVDIDTDVRSVFVQMAICRFACYSRPPVPLSCILMYLTSVSAPYSVPIFNFCLVHLPYTLATKFVEAVVNSPFPLQRFGLYLAFKFYNAEDLKLLVLKVWKETKDISLKSILYKNLFEQMLIEDKASQKELCEALKVFTSEIDENATKEIMSLVSWNKLSADIRGEMLKPVWLAVSQFTETEANLQHQIKILKVIKTNITLMDRKFLMEFIINPHINEMLTEKKIRPSYYSREISMRVKTKWVLIARYIVTADNELAVKESTELVTSILKMCAEMWSEVHDEIYTIKLFCANFITSLISNSNNFYKNFKYVNCIFEKILLTVQNLLPAHEMYLIIWKLWTVIITRKVCSKLEYNECGYFENIEWEKICDEYANEIANLVVRLVIKGQFYHSFLSQIHDVVESQIKVFAVAIDKDFELILITICKYLTRFKITEVYILALMLLPLKCKRENYEIFLSTLQNIKEIDIDEVQSFLLKKYISADFIYRKYI